jgi:hypothetical protein
MIAQNRLTAFVGVALCVMAVSLCTGSTIQGQGCTTLNPNVEAWPRSSTVYIDLGNLNTEQRRQVTLAIQSWNQANQTNGSYVEFSFGTPPSSTSFRLTFQIGQIPFNPQTGQHPPAQLDRTGGIDGQGNLNRATITFDPSAQRTDSSGNPVQALMKRYLPMLLQKRLCTKVSHG